MAKPEEAAAEGEARAAEAEPRQEEPPRRPLPPTLGAPSPGGPLSAEESECRICYNRFDLERHAPKVLACLHTFCRECLARLHRRRPPSPPRGPSPSPASLSCPVCRALTALPGGRVQDLPVDARLVEALLLQLRGWAPLLQDLRPQRLLWPKPAASPPASPASSPSAASSAASSPSGAVTFRTLEAGTCPGGPRLGGEEAPSCSAVCRRKAGCACALFLALALALLAAAWMEWLSGSLFLAVALLLLFASTVPFLYSFNSTFRRQPRTIFFTRAAAAGSREGNSGRGEDPGSRPSAEGRGAW